MKLTSAEFVAASEPAVESTTPVPASMAASTSVARRSRRTHEGERRCHHDDEH